MNKLLLLLLAPMALVAMEQPNKSKLNPPSLKTLAALVVPQRPQIIAQLFSFFSQDAEQLEKNLQVVCPELKRHLAFAKENRDLFRAKNYTGLLFKAAEFGYSEFIPELIACGAHVNVHHTDYEGQTPLIKAAKNGHSMCIEKLIQCGAWVNLKDDWGDAPLTYAAGAGHPDCVNQLLKSKARINSQNKTGETALMYAARANRIQCVKLLLKNGANKKLRDSRNLTAVQQALINGYIDCIKLLSPLPKQFCENLHQKT